MPEAQAEPPAREISTTDVNDVDPDTLYYLRKPSTNARATNKDGDPLIIEGNPVALERAIAENDEYVYPDTGRLEPISVEAFYRRFREAEREAKRRAKNDREE